MEAWFRRIWNEIGVYKARHPLIGGMWFVGGKLFVAREATAEDVFLQSLDLKGKVVYDIGANVGVMTLFFAKAVGADGEVLAFEPHPYSFRRLCRNVKVNRLKHVRGFQKAVGNEPAKLELYQPSRHLSAATFDKERALGLREGDLVVHEVEVDTLDAYIHKHALPAPHLIKVDVEGFEVAVLLGAEETIQRWRPAWFIEIHTRGNGETTAPELVDMLTKRDYELFHVESQGVVHSETASALRGGHLYANPR